MKIFRLKSNSRDFASFIEDYPDGQQSIIGRAMAQQWKPFEADFQPIALIQRASDKGKKNYQFDVSGALGPFFVFSENGIQALSEGFLAKHGQFLPVNTPSKRKTFLGYYPINPAPNCLDMERSKYRIYENGLVIDKVVLVGNNLPQRDVFVIEEDIMRIFVTARFKRHVEVAGLNGFDFSDEIEVS